MIRETATVNKVKQSKSNFQALHIHYTSMKGYVGGLPKLHLLVYEPSHYVKEKLLLGDVAFVWCLFYVWYLRSPSSGLEN